MYEINRETLIIIQKETDECEVVEKSNTFTFNENPKKIINNSCRYFGSSYEGRLSGTKKIMGINYKAPIIIEESDDIVFFPTASPRINKCHWVSLKNIKNYIKYGNKTLIVFSNDQEIVVDISYNSLNNQVLRAARLQMLIKSRKIKQNY